ncbi:MAG: methyltransferase [Alphaproteobacteria bacterium]|nr:methyltransferase [Alphaproteobacteria bacterium]MCB9931118.1 methyltransferase [Alphaproteobacteria bacterium]
MDLDDFIRANTTVTAPKLVPEIRLHLATELTPLWHATESYLNQININAPFWAFAWVGGQALARYILDDPEAVRGLRLVDIGSGGGIVSIAAALAGAEHVTALDIDPVAGTVCRLNAELNGVAERISCETADAITYDFAPFDLILVGDVCYTRGESADLADHLREAAAPVLFGDPGRQFLPRRGIRQVATYTVETSREIEANAITEASVWRMIGL